MDWTAALFPQIPWIEKILRPIIVYAAIVVVIHLAGKRELAQVNSFDLVVLLLISNVVQNATIGDDNSILGGLVGAAALVAANYLVVRFLFNRAKLDRPSRDLEYRVPSCGKAQNHPPGGRFVCRRGGVRSVPRGPDLCARRIA